MNKTNITGNGTFIILSNPAHTTSMITVAGDAGGASTQIVFSDGRGGWVTDPNFDIEVGFGGVALHGHGRSMALQVTNGTNVDLTVAVSLIS